MPDSLVVEVIGGENMSNEQAKYFALSIFAGMKAYVKEHRTEFELWMANGNDKQRQTQAKFVQQ